MSKITEPTFFQVPITVALATCLECGAGILLDPRDEINAIELHEEFHKTFRGLEACTLILTESLGSGSLQSSGPEPTDG